MNDLSIKLTEGMMQLNQGDLPYWAKHHAQSVIYDYIVNSLSHECVAFSTYVDLQGFSPRRADAFLRFYKANENQITDIIEDIGNHAFFRYGHSA